MHLWRATPYWRMLDLILREVDGDMASPLIPLATDLGRHFLYARYNADLSAQGLRAAGFNDVIPANIQKMDGVENMEMLHNIGRKAGLAVDATRAPSFRRIKATRLRAIDSSVRSFLRPHMKSGRQCRNLS